MRSEKLHDAVHALIKKTILKHKRVIFNGNGYAASWLDEAKKRGLYNLASTPDVLPCFISEKNKTLFTKHHIFTETEITSRYEILLENYCKTIHIEANTLVDMIRKDFLPALTVYTRRLADDILSKKTVAELPCTSERKLLSKLSTCYDELSELTDTLAEDIRKVESMEDMLAASKFYHDTILEDMGSIRTLADTVEKDIPDDILPYPDYDELLFYL